MDRRVWSAEADVVGGGSTGVRGPDPRAVTFRRAASSSRPMVPLARLFAVVHLCVSVAHGASHAALGIWPGAADAVFIALAVYAAPAAAVALLPRRSAGWLLAGSMAGAPGFGAPHHFLVPPADHVAMLPPGEWSDVFPASAMPSGPRRPPALPAGLGRGGRWA